MRKYACEVAYDGTPYHGFERQKDYPTVQGEIEKQLSFLLGIETKIKGAGRTDAGVHALGQVFSFQAKEIKDLNKFQDALNRLLPRSIEICSTKEVPDSFDPRHSCCKKRYCYRFSYGLKYPLMGAAMAFLGNRRDFDEALFIEAIRCYEGVHKFWNFTTKKEDKDDFIRNVHIEKITVDPRLRTGEVILASNGFMTYMVRMMIGTAFKVAFSVFPLEELKKRLDGNEHNPLSFKAPADGLILYEVQYKEPLE